MFDASATVQWEIFCEAEFFTIFVIQCKVTKICSHKHLFANSAYIYQLNRNIVIEMLSRLQIKHDL